ncbi:glycosyltransferase family 4 protein [Stieleria sp. JC731]|uniref:glycosyltransferase family 4 protein n=1 Tax=Stieleria sp. JC731 TaxID=2894195 RepID=UPI001E43B508|nr:glycosyltransferase family 4 protein [Stieleria sp. JC731]
MFWQESISMHQAGLLAEVASQSNGSVLLVVSRETDRERLSQGWSQRLPQGVDLEVAPDPARLRQIVKSKSHSDCYHVFSGICAYPMVEQAMQLVRPTDAKLFVYTERPDLRSNKRRLIIPLRDRWRAWCWRQRIDGILAIGEAASRYYERVGYHSSKIHQFGYFPRCEATGECKNRDKHLQLVCVARQVELKRIDLVLEALSENIDHNWRLTVVGDGPLLQHNKQLAIQLGLSDRINWLGSVAHDDVLSTIQASDVLVLASSYDGWGAVINEAIANGLRVIASDACGASSAIREQEFASVFPANDGRALTDRLRFEIERGRQSHESRNAIRDWYEKSISPKAGAQYLIELLRDRHAVAPWFITRGGSSDPAC